MEDLFMRKIYKALVLILAAVFFLQAGQIFAAAEDAGTSEDWEMTDTISLDVASTYAQEILADPLAAFDGLQVREVYITEKRTLEDSSLYLSLLLVAEEGAQIDAMVPQLSEDVRFNNVHHNVPTETVNTLELIPSAGTVEVGKTVTIQLDGTLEIGSSSNEPPYKTISAVTGNFDPEKEYTPADFPQFAFSEVEVNSFPGDTRGYFTLTLAEPGYCNFYRAINALALDPNIVEVQSGDYFDVPDVFYDPEWEISDPSVASFVTDTPDENGQMVLEGLQPGKVTITYTPSLGYYLGTEYAVTCEITVTEGEPAPVTTETTGEPAPVSETTDPPAGGGNDSPQTGDGSFGFLCIFCASALAGVAALWIIRHRRRSGC